MVSITTFTLYALAGYELKADLIFPALAYFNIIRMPMIMFPVRYKNNCCINTCL